MIEPMRPLAVVLALVSSCAPSFVDCPWPDEEVQRVLDETADGWERRLGERADFSGILVECRPGRTVIFEWRGEQHESYGVTLSRDHVLVPTDGFPSARSSTLGHELIHVGLWRTNGDPDSDHLGPDRGWTQDHSDIVTDVTGW